MYGRPRRLVRPFCRPPLHPILMLYHIQRSGALYHFSPTSRMTNRSLTSHGSSLLAFPTVVCGGINLRSGEVHNGLISHGHKLVHHRRKPTMAVFRNGAMDAAKAVVPSRDSFDERRQTGATLRRQKNKRRQVVVVDGNKTKLILKIRSFKR